MNAPRPADELAMQRSSLLLDAGRPAEARVVVQQALQLSPQSNRLRLQLARVELELGHWTVTEHLTREVLATDHRNEWAVRLQAIALLNAGRTREAVTAATRAVQLGNSSVASLDTLARALSQDRQHAYAIATATTRRDLDGNDSEGWLLLGNIFHRAGKLADAEAAYKECIRLNPNDSSAVANLGNVIGHLGRGEESIQLLSRAGAMDPARQDPARTIAAVVHHAARSERTVSGKRRRKAGLLQQVPDGALPKEREELRRHQRATNQAAHVERQAELKIALNGSFRSRKALLSYALLATAFAISVLAGSRHSPDEPSVPPVVTMRIAPPPTPPLPTMITRPTPPSWPVIVTITLSPSTVEPSTVETSTSTVATTTMSPP